MPYKPNDYFARKARQEDYAARSVYKLEEIDNRFKIFHSGDYIMDLGVAPGSWSQYASKKIGDKGKILSIDLKPVNIQLANAIFIQGDLNELNIDDILIKYNFNHLFDAVISDMAPNTTGNKFVDQTRSLDLCYLALETAKRFLKTNGNFVCKLFDGEDAMSFRDDLKKYFQTVNIIRPKSTQSSSKEIFFVAKGFEKSIFAHDNK